MSQRTEEIYDPKYVLVGEKLICIGRDIYKPQVRPGSSKHKTQQIVVEGTYRNPARCFISKPARIVKDNFQK